jgi:hypothetical protein
MSRTWCWVFILFLGSATNCFAGEHTSHKNFDKPAQEVFDAAERAASQMGARIQQRDVSTRTLVFSSAQSSGMEQYSGYHATFVAEEQPSAKSPRTTARLRVSGVSWSHLSGGTDASSTIASQFFAALRRELGLCKSCSSPIAGGGGLNLPRVQKQ